MRPSAGMEINVDPLGSFKGVKESKLLAATGLLPYFIQEVAMSVPLDAVEAMDMMKECYGFPSPDMLQDGKGEVSEDGTYKYPEDPSMAPMVAFEVQGEKEPIEILVYQYAFVVVRDGANTLMTRMD